MASLIPFSYLIYYSLYRPKAHFIHDYIYPSRPPPQRTVSGREWCPPFAFVFQNKVLKVRFQNQLRPKSSTDYKSRFIFTFPAPRSSPNTLVCVIYIYFLNWNSKRTIYPDSSDPHQLCVRHPRLPSNTRTAPHLIHASIYRAFVQETSTSPLTPIRTGHNEYGARACDVHFDCVLTNYAAARWWYAVASAKASG